MIFYETSSSDSSLAKWGMHGKNFMNLSDEQPNSLDA